MKAVMGQLGKSVCGGGVAESCWETLAGGSRDGRHQRGGSQLSWGTAY